MNDIQTPRRHGTAQVSADLWPEIGSPETNEDWEKTLLLPENYKIVQVVRQSNDLFVLTMSSEDIPEDNVTLSLTYQQDIRQYGDILHKNVTLIRIRMTKWDGEEWKCVGEREVRA